MDCEIITWRGGWEMGKYAPKLSHTAISLSEN